MPRAGLHAVLCITMKSDSEEHFSMLSPPRDWSREEPRNPAKEAADHAEFLTGFLERDSCLIFGHEGSLTTMRGKEGLAASFGVMMELHQSSHTDEEKFILLQRCGMLAPGRPTEMPGLVTNFKPNKQLEKRMARLIDQLTKETEGLGVETFKFRMLRVEDLEAMGEDER